MLAAAGGHRVCVWDWKRVLTDKESGATPIVSVATPLPVEGTAFMAHQPVLLVGGQSTEEL